VVEAAAHALLSAMNRIRNSEQQEAHRAGEDPLATQQEVAQP